MKVLQLLQEAGFSFTKKGKNYVCRCPVCKGDNRLSDHNAEINTDTNSIYCFSEQKLYTYAELLKELKGVDISYAIQKRKQNAKENFERTKKEPEDFEKIKSELIQQGYSVVAVYDYLNLAGEIEYQIYRFEKENAGQIEKTFRYRSPDGKAGLNGKKQIPYGLDQFLYTHANEIWIAEGEKCTDAVIANMPSSASLIALGYHKPADFEGFENLFLGKDVVIFTDNDPTGRKNTKELVNLFKQYVSTVKVIEFKEYTSGYDVADFLEQNDWNELIQKVNSTEYVYKSPIFQVTQGRKKERKTEKEFILEPFIPAKSVILFDGLGESGKSVFAMQLCLSVATGKPFLNYAIQPEETHRVLYFTAEETDYSFDMRLEKIQKALKLSDDEIKNFYWISTLSKDFQCSTYSLLSSSSKGIQKTEFHHYLETLLKHIKPSLVVLDSLANFYGLDENSTEHALKFIETLKLLTKDYDCSFLLLHHQTKEAMRQGGEKIFRGSGVFREQARCRFFIEKKSETVKKVTIEKLNIHTALKREFYVKLATVDENLEPCLCFVETDFEEEQEEKQEKKGNRSNGKNGKNF